MSKSWTIGSSSDCDLVVNRPTVSGYHCRLTHREDGYVLEDLNSTNGTYVNGARVTARTPVTRADSITLGLVLPMPWPPEALPHGSKIVRIGREPDNDYVVDLPMVSGYHARIIWNGTPGEALIEDVGSSNGTALGSPDGKIIRSVLSESDTIYLGSHPIPAARVMTLFPTASVPSLSARDNPVVTGSDRETPAAPESQATASALSPVLNVTGRPSAPIWTDLAPESSRILHPRWRPVVLLIQAPLLALVIVMALPMEAPGPTISASWPEVSRTLAAALSRLSLAAVWFGLSGAVLGSVFDSTRPGDGARPRGIARFFARLTVLGALCGLQCTLAWIVVSTGTGLKGMGFPALALLLLASAVGLALGLAIISMAPHPAPAWVALPLIMLPLWLLGGQQRPLFRMAPWARMAANALPSRWAFEGLLLLESDRRPAPVVTDAPHGGQDGARPATPPDSPDVPDLVEGYFPAETDRMGVKADILALGSMFIGLAALVAFISAHPEPGS